MRKVVEFDEFSRCCKYFKSGEDYGFECLHPEQEERETYNGRELGRCFSCSCPLGIEAEQEDYGAKWTIVNKVDKQKSKIYRKFTSA